MEVVEEPSHGMLLMVLVLLARIEAAPCDVM